MHTSIHSSQGKRRMLVAAMACALLCAACGGGTGGGTGAPPAAGTPLPEITLYAGALESDATPRGSSDGNLLAARFSHPQALAFDAAGNLFVSDTGNQTIRKISAAGQVTTFAGTADAAGNSAFVEPLGLAFDALGNLLVADGYAIKQVTPAGAISTVALIPRGENNGRGGVLGVLMSIAKDVAGNLYAVNMLGIRKIAPDGSYRILLGFDTGAGGNNTVLIERRGLLIGTDGRLIGTRGSAIYRFDASGNYDVLAGDPEQAGAVDGTGATARFSRSIMLAQDKAGNLYAADVHNATIRKITPAGVVTTVAGTKGIFETMLGKLPGSMMPAGIAVAPSGELFVSSRSAILKITLP